MFDTLDHTIQNPRSAWTATASFTLQAFGVGVLLLLPLIYTDALPVLRNDKFQLPPPPQTRMETVTRIISTEIQKPTTTEFDGTHLIAPQRVPLTIQRIVEKAVGPAGDPAPTGIGIPGGTNDNESDFLKNLIAVADPPHVPPANVAPKTIRVSSLELGALVRRVEPVYPTQARLARIQGPVKMHAVIDTSGRITSLQVLNGHPLLIAAAMDAVRQWRYRPYSLNGEPVPVETEITVNFTLN